MRRLLVPSLLVLAVLPGLTGCSGDVTKDEYLDHAVEFSTSATTSEAKAEIRRIFDCAWPAISKDQDLLDDFMDASESSPQLSERVSRLLVPCITTDTTAATTTVP